MARVQYALRSSVTVVPMQLLMYDSQPDSEPDCRALRTSALHWLVKNHAAEPKSYFSSESRRSRTLPTSPEADCASPCMSGMDAAYFWLKVGDCILRAFSPPQNVSHITIEKTDREKERHVLPCPVTPGKWFRLYLKSPVSNAIRLMSAACSAGDVTWYV
jgi:hypothetical protein